MSAFRSYATIVNVTRQRDNNRFTLLEGEGRTRASTNERDTRSNTYIENRDPVKASARSFASHMQINA